MTALQSKKEYTFKGNLKDSRYGWLRLTPAYSVTLVTELLETYATKDSVILDPFCGTGTTALVCAERGIHCDTSDINPFLLWLTRAKTQKYSDREIKQFRLHATSIASALEHPDHESHWIPPLSHIERWWDPATLATLAQIKDLIDQSTGTDPDHVRNLLLVAFCRVLIESSHASFGHQSMSFKKVSNGLQLTFFEEHSDVNRMWNRASSSIADAASSSILRKPKTFYCDARSMSETCSRERYSLVITSPPYPNRMSYIRELRPYMFWLGYLTNGHAAGELDWQAIGGTWGCATSKLQTWEPPRASALPFDEFHTILGHISEKSIVLARYIEKYFHDMHRHIQELFPLLKTGGSIQYVVGNSKFYETLLPVESLFATLFADAGFVDTAILPIRQRSSKKELMEYVVSARKP